MGGRDGRPYKVVQYELVYGANVFIWNTKLFNHSKCEQKGSLVRFTILVTEASSSSN